MKLTLIDALPDDQAAAAAAQLLAAHEAGNTIAMPNPHYPGLRVSDRFLAPIAARAAQEHTTPQALVDQAIEGYLQRHRA